MVLAQRYPIERSLFSILGLWGVCLCTIACFNYQGLYAQRFALGLLNVGVSPIFMISVGLFYKRGEQDFRMGIWYSASKRISASVVFISTRHWKIAGFVAIFSP